MMTALAARYEVITQDISSMLAEKEPCMCGRATLVMLVSSTCITVTIITEKVMAHFRAAPRGASLTSAGGVGAIRGYFSKLRHPPAKECSMMRSLRFAAAVLAVAALAVTSTARAQSDVRSPLPAPVKVRLGMTNVPALSALWLLPDYAAKYNIQMETVLFQRFADARTALAGGDLDITAFGPQDISLGLGQGAKSMVGVAGVGSGNDCLVVRKGDDVKDWQALAGKAIGVGAGSISWLKFAGYAQYASIDHNTSKTVGGLIAVLAVNRGFMDKQRDAVQRLVVAYLDVLKFAQANRDRWSRIYAEKAGLPEPVAAESIRITRLDATLPLQSIKRISKFLSDTGVIARDVSGEVAQSYTYDFLSKATGKSPAELGLGQ